jgi:chitodextrinase
MTMTTRTRRRTTRRLPAVIAALAACAALGTLTAGGASAATKQRADVYSVAALPQLVDMGDSTLVRTPSGIRATLRTTGLEPGPHTLWWVVWNNPEACGADGCDEADLGVPGVDADIGYAAGAVVGHDGRASFAASLREGRALQGFPPELGWTSGSGLADSERSEVHLVIRTHGPTIRGLVGDMRRTFHGGCDYAVFGGLVPEGAYGAPGPNFCTDVQFAVHPA